MLGILMGQVWDDLEVGPRTQPVVVNRMIWNMCTVFPIFIDVFLFYL